MDEPRAPRAIATDEAPAAVGPYSQAVASGGFLFCSGQLGLVPETGELAAGGIANQARQAMENLRAVARAAGADLARAVKVTVYLTDMADFAAVNQVYAEAFSQPFPARAAVGASALPKGARVMMDAVVALA